MFTLKIEMETRVRISPEIT